MYPDVIFITKERSKSQAFVVGSKNVPVFIMDCAKVLDNGNFLFKYHEKDSIECKPGDIVYFGGSNPRDLHLLLLNPANYIVSGNDIYEKHPIYIACKVTKDRPPFLDDVNITFDGSSWNLFTSRLRIRVNLGDYWIRDIETRYEVPIVSCLETDGQSFEKYWRCDKDGNYIERLTEYDRIASLNPSG